MANLHVRLHPSPAEIVDLPAWCEMFADRIQVGTDDWWLPRGIWHRVTADLIKQLSIKATSHRTPVDQAGRIRTILETIQTFGLDVPLLQQESDTSQISAGTC